MKINAIDVLAMKKANFNLRNVEPQSTSAVETPVSNPEAGLGALNAQAMNNITFQGVQMPTKMVKNLSKYMLVAAMSALAVSCTEPIFEFKQEATVEINMESIMSMFDKMLQMYQQMLDMQKINNEQNEAMKEFMATLIEEVEAGRISQEEFNKSVLEYMMNDSVMQENIYNQLVDNGKTQEEALAAIAEIKDLIAAGKFDEAFKIINEILGTVQEIKGLLDQIAENQIAFHNEQMEAQNKANEYLDKLYNQGVMDFKMYEELREILKHIDKNTALTLANAENLLAIVKDETRHRELIDAIKNLDEDSVDFAKFEEMFKFYGLTIAEAVEMSADQLEAALKTFIDTYKDTEADKKVDMDNKFNEIIERFDKLIDKVGALSNDLSLYNEIYMDNFEQVIQLLAKFDGNLEALKNAQDKANKYLASLLEKAGQAVELLESIAEDNEGMTIDQFKEYMNERDAAQYKKFVQLMIDMGLDKLAGDVATIKDLVAAIKDKVDAQENYAGRLDAILAKLDGIDFTQEENQELLKQILEAIKNHECNCNCSDGKNHEGIFGDFEDLLG